MCETKRTFDDGCGAAPSRLLAKRNGATLASLARSTADRDDHHRAPSDTLLLSATTDFDDV